MIRTLATLTRLYATCAKTPPRPLQQPPSPSAKPQSPAALGRAPQRQRPPLVAKQPRGRRHRCRCRCLCRTPPSCRRGQHSHKSNIRELRRHLRRLRRCCRHRHRRRRSTRGASGFGSSCVACSPALSGAEATATRVWAPTTAARCAAWQPRRSGVRRWPANGRASGWTPASCRLPRLPGRRACFRSGSRRAWRGALGRRCGWASLCRDRTSWRHEAHSMMKICLPRASCRQLERV